MLGKEVLKASQAFSHYKDVKCLFCIKPSEEMNQLRKQLETIKFSARAQEITNKNSYNKQATR